MIILQYILLTDMELAFTKFEKSGRIAELVLCA